MRDQITTGLRSRYRDRPAVCRVAGQRVSEVGHGRHCVGARNLVVCSVTGENAIDVVRHVVHQGDRNPSTEILAQFSITDLVIPVWRNDRNFHVAIARIVVIPRPWSGIGGINCVAEVRRRGDLDRRSSRNRVRARSCGDRGATVDAHEVSHVVGQVDRVRCVGWNSWSTANTVHKGWISNCRLVQAVTGRDELVWVPRGRAGQGVAKQRHCLDGHGGSDRERVGSSTDVGVTAAVNVSLVLHTSHRRNRETAVTVHTWPGAHRGGVTRAGRFCVHGAIGGGHNRVRTPRGLAGQVVPGLRNGVNCYDSPDRCGVSASSDICEPTTVEVDLVLHSDYRRNCETAVGVSAGASADRIVE